ncbi:hypothetical protein BDV96DRAFT_655363 [Lophiotrema nucula]|uniref:Transmembrane protein n=1 Tax=Lophiotrema nucula TaxID=690887 RepID=A0A6A5YHM0_9PLEO|nr:hypothetical protein BDV96DRAFT_655363 [Lophiotrema nucula]
MASSNNQAPAVSTHQEIPEPSETATQPDQQWNEDHESIVDPFGNMVSSYVDTALEYVTDNMQAARVYYRQVVVIFVWFVVVLSYLGLVGAGLLLFYQAMRFLHFLYTWVGISENFMCSFVFATVGLLFCTIIIVGPLLYLIELTCNGFKQVKANISRDLAHWVQTGEVDTGLVRPFQRAYQNVKDTLDEYGIWAE